MRVIEGRNGGVENGEGSCYRRRCEEKWQGEKMTDVTVRGGLMKGNVIPFTLKERNNGRWQRIRAGGRRARDEMKRWEIRGALQAHMAADMVNLDCLCGGQRSRMLFLFFNSLYQQYALYSCVYTVYYMCVFGFLGLLSLGMGWMTARRTGVEWGLAARGSLWESEDRNRHTHWQRERVRHWTGGLGCVFLLNGFKTPVQGPLFH